MKVIAPTWPAPKNIKAFTTLKTLWGTGPYLNSVSFEEFAKSSQTLIESLSLPNEPIWLNQTHTNKVLPATPANRSKEADASFTSDVNQVCVVTTADCLPVLICNRSGTKVAAAHAGWRGLANNIVENTVDAMDEDYENLMVWLGPAIGPSKFEVGQDVFDAFTHKDPHSEAAFQSHLPGKWMANLYDLAKIRLTAKGVHAIYGGEYCTFSQPDLFFSYRRDKGHTGRMASLIWIER